MKPKIPLWVAVVFLLFVVALWVPRCMPRKSSGPDKPKTAQSKHDWFNTLLQDAIKQSEPAEDRSKMLAWVAPKLNVPAAQLAQECQQFKLSVPELYYVYLLRPGGGTISPIETIMSIYETEKDWYIVGQRRGFYPTDFSDAFKQMAEAAKEK